MDKIRATIRKRVEGEVQYNDGYFAEIETYGIYGIETGLILDRIQVDCCATNDEPEEFRRKFRVGALVKITTTVEIRSTSRTARDWKKLSDACDKAQRKFVAESERYRKKHAN